jgi:hypothetical protein
MITNGIIETYASFRNPAIIEKIPSKIRTTPIPSNNKFIIVDKKMKIVKSSLGFYLPLLIFPILVTLVYLTTGFQFDGEIFYDILILIGISGVFGGFISPYALKKNSLKLTGVLGLVTLTPVLWLVIEAQGFREPTDIGGVFVFILIALFIIVLLMLFFGGVVVIFISSLIGSLIGRQVFPRSKFEDLELDYGD